MMDYVGGSSRRSWSMNLIRHRGDGTYLGSGWVITPCVQTLQSLGTVTGASHQEIRCRLHNPDIESKVMYMILVIMRKIAWFLFIIELHDSLIRLAYPCFLCSCLVLYVSFCDDHLFGGSRCGCNVKGTSEG